MTPQLRVPADVQTIITDHLRVLFAGRGLQCTVSQNVPAQWDPGKPEHVQVIDAPTSLSKGWGRVSASATTGPIQITVYAKDSTTAKHLANLAITLLFVAHRPRGIATITEGTGISTARDEKTGAEMAFGTVRVTAMTVPA